MNLDPAKNELSKLDHTIAQMKAEIEERRGKIPFLEAQATALRTAIAGQEKSEAASAEAPQPAAK